MPLLSKALKTESYSKSRKAVRYVVFMFVILFLSFLTYSQSFQRSVSSPKRGSRPAEVNMVRFPDKKSYEAMFAS